MSADSLEFNEDGHTERASVFTFVTGSTVWGPGALTGKLLKAVGEIGLDMIVEVIVRRRLSVIKRTFKKRPAVFLLGYRSQDAEESQQILHDLEEMCQDDYSGSVRATATMLLVRIQLYQQVPVVREALAKNTTIFTNPQNEYEELLANRTVDALRVLMAYRSDNLGIAARRLVDSITKLSIEMGLNSLFKVASAIVEAKKWKVMTSAVRTYDPIDITETKMPNPVFIDDSNLENLLGKPYHEEIKSKAHPARGVMVITGATTVITDG